MARYNDPKTKKTVEAPNAKAAKEASKPKAKAKPKTTAKSKADTADIPAAEVTETKED